MCHQKANGPRNAKQTVYFSRYVNVIDDVLWTCFSCTELVPCFSLQQHIFLQRYKTTYKRKRKRFIWFCSKIKNIFRLWGILSTKYSVKSFFVGCISFKEDILRSAGDRGICFCTAHYSTTECTVHLSVRLGLRPVLLAMRWPLSLGISNLHNHCWLLLTGLSRRLSVWLETLRKSAGCQKKKTPSMTFPCHPRQDQNLSFFTKCTKTGSLHCWLRLILYCTGGFSGNTV